MSPWCHSIKSGSFWESGGILWFCVGRSGVGAIILYDCIGVVNCVSEPMFVNEYEAVPEVLVSASTRAAAKAYLEKWGE